MSTGLYLFGGLGAAAIYFYFKEKNAKTLAPPLMGVPDSRTAYEAPELPFSSKFTAHPLDAEETKYNFEMQRWMAFDFSGKGNVRTLIQSFGTKEHGVFTATELAQIETSANAYYTNAFGDDSVKDYDAWIATPTGKDFLSKLRGWEMYQSCLANETGDNPNFNTASGRTFCAKKYPFEPFLPPQGTAILGSKSKSSKGAAFF